MKITSNAVLWIVVAAFFASLFVLDHNNIQYISFRGLVAYLLAWGLIFSFFILWINKRKSPTNH